MIETPSQYLILIYEEETPIDVNAVKKEYFVDLEWFYNGSSIRDTKTLRVFQTREEAEKYRSTDGKKDAESYFQKGYI